MDNLGLQIVLILLFILIGAVFVAAEMSLVTLRESQLRQLAQRGARGRKVADLAANPNRFLSAVQICITVFGFLAASFGADTVAERLAGWLSGHGVPGAQAIALIAVTLVISYFSIVLGELSAKRLAMQRAESMALTLAGPIDLIARLLSPVIWLLGASTNIIVRLLGGDPKASREAVTEEEIRAMVTESAFLGVEERQIVDEVFAAGQRTLREVMVPRTEAKFLDGDLPARQAITEIESAAHSRYPVIGQSVDDIIGFLHVRDLMDLDPPTLRAPIRQLVRPIIALPDTVKVLHALNDMRRQHSHLAIVRDEYGGTAGIVTLEDLVEELVGDIEDEYDVPSPTPSTEADGIDGLTTLEEFEHLTGYRLPEGPYDTVAGFWVAQRGAMPTVGDTITVDLLRPRSQVLVRCEMKVTETDGRRASRIALRPVTPLAGTESVST
ncbi:MAG: hemolysin family protein [Propionibacteriaceae bacterium]|jgi:putative hemolysin|nr:hemolysin family protein [Propionibacteriaceae bacterium]